MINTVSAIYDSLLSTGDDKKISNAILIHLGPLLRLPVKVGFRKTTLAKVNFKVTFNFFSLLQPTDKIKLAFLKLKLTFLAVLN